jgi:hypothetical protein
MGAFPLCGPDYWRVGDVLHVYSLYRAPWHLIAMTVAVHYGTS